MPAGRHCALLLQSLRDRQIAPMKRAAAMAAVLGSCGGAFVPDDSARAPAASPYYLLEPSAFATPLGDDLAWAVENIPLFESANATLDMVYYFRWRTYKSHIHPTNCSAGEKAGKVCKNRTDDIDYVVTEFSPDVPWAGQYNTINCAAGHHSNPPPTHALFEPLAGRSSLPLPACRMLAVHEIALTPLPSLLWPQCSRAGGCASRCTWTHIHGGG